MALNEAERRAAELAEEVGHWLKGTTPGTKIHVPQEWDVEDSICSFGGPDHTRQVPVDNLPDSRLEGNLCGYCERIITGDDPDYEGADREPEDVLRDLGFEVDG